MSMQPTGTQCARCERLRLRSRVEELERQNGQLEDALAQERWHLGAIARSTARIEHLERECEALRVECRRLEAFEPTPGRTLRYHNPRHVLVKRPGQCSVTDHIPEWVEIKL